MKMFKILLLTLAACFYISNSFAEYNADKLGEAAGAYLVATDVMEKISKSECGWVTKSRLITKKSYNLDETKGEIILYLTEKDAKNIQEYLESSEFKKELAENDAYITGIMAPDKMGSGAYKDNYCVQIVSKVLSIYAEAEQNWNNAKRMHANNNLVQEEKSFGETLKYNAESGDPEALNILGELYIGALHIDGVKVAKDYKEAAKYFLRAANQGHAKAQFNLGYMYLEGLGVDKNLEEQMKWTLKAAENDHVGGQTSAGLAFLYGLGVQKNASNALFWFKKASMQGDKTAQFQLGSMYYHGIGTPSNYIKSYTWFSLSAAQGNEDAKDVIEVVKDQMTPHQIAEAQKEASDLWEKIKR